MLHWNSQTLQESICNRKCSSHQVLHCLHILSADCWQQKCKTGYEGMPFLRSVMSLSALGSSQNIGLKVQANISQTLRNEPACSHVPHHKTEISRIHGCCGGNAQSLVQNSDRASTSRVSLRILSCCLAMLSPTSISFSSRGT